jgi:alkanesulfonate monooxygenase SsuD/methylene tetrahydromethanopterin reductase-like flavin-dependent oxidoreductase (luciferase family)
VTETRPLAVGVVPLETRRDVVVHLACRAEELGYSAFYVAEGWGHDAAVLLAEIATRTERIRIGTGVLNVWGRSAGTLAMLATSLDELSGGRFDLGLGSGSPVLAEGLHDTAFREPVRRLATVTRQVRGLLDGERLNPSVAGAAPALRLAVRSRSRVPITLAALGPAATAVAGELADNWAPFLLPRSGLPAYRGHLERGAARGGRDGLPGVRPAIPVALSDDPAAARRAAAWWVAFYLTSMGPLYATTLRRLGHGREVDDVVAANPGRGTAEVPPSAEGLLDELTLRGDAPTIRAGLDHWYASGADMPTLALPPGADLADLDRTLEALRPR